jgi:hypothetical protein
MPNGAKKAFYLFLTSLLGVFLFLILHRVVFFLYLYMIGQGLIGTSMDYYQMLLFEYFSLIICLMLGSWYGIWLGIYWFEKVYEEKSHGGFVHHLSKNYFLPKPKVVESRMTEIKERLETNLHELENLAESTVSQLEVMPKPIKRRVVRKKAPKKLNSL